VTRDLVVCSLEPWDDVWRRNQFLVRELRILRPDTRVLFVAPPVDILHAAIRGMAVPSHGLREVETGHLWELMPRKVWPRLLGPLADRSLFRAVSSTVKGLGFHDPVLWVNDSVYAGLAALHPWPTVYDVTDDWLHSDVPRRERRRREARERLLLRRADEVVVCSSGLAASRGANRPVHLIPNAVDQDLFCRATARPRDLPPGRCAVYVGSLHDDRIDIGLVEALAVAEPEISIVMVGPNSLSSGSKSRLAALGNVHLTGPRPYLEVPAYLQHATVVIVPHRVTAFTESLDPIKAYECEAVGRPTIATPVPGFIPDRGCIRIATPSEWVSAVTAAVQQLAESAPTLGLPTWAERARAFDRVLWLASEHRSHIDMGTSAR
jgi:teichuronic acid biosynthesis glycosyltransferase TuaH